MITIEWDEFRWTPPKANEEMYWMLRGMGEPQFRVFRKQAERELCDRFRKQTAYTWKPFAFILGLGFVLIGLGYAFDVDLPKGLGGLCFFGAFFAFASWSLTHDSFAAPVAALRRYLLKCWIASQNLGFPEYARYVETHFLFD